MAKQDEYVRYTIRVPAELYEKLQQAAGEKSINAEVVGRLEDSFGSLAAYQELTSLFLETMQEQAERGKREVLEYRQMVGTVRLMRYTIDRFVEFTSDRPLPDDLQNLLSVLAPGKKEEDVSAILNDLVEAMEAYQALELEEAQNDGKSHRDSIRQRLLKLQGRFQQLVAPATMRSLDHPPRAARDRD